MSRGSRGPRSDAGAAHGSPRWLGLPAALAVALLVLPVVGLLDSLDAGRWFALVTSESALTALGVSLRTALTSTAVCVVGGVPLAVLLAHHRSRLASTVRVLVLLPLVLPPVVSGLALLTTFGRRGLLGRSMHLLGIDLPFTTAAVVLAQTFVALPFLVLTIEGALRGRTTELEEAAATLGARPTTVLLRVTLPQVAPALRAGIVLAFARALGEFGATLTFAGSLQGRTRTLPLEVYLQREVDPAAAVAVSTLLVALAVGIVATVYGRSTPAPG